MANKLLLALLLALTALPGQAMRCGNRLVQAGDTKLEVLNKCGEPTFAEGSGVIEQEEEIAAADRLNDQLLLIGRHQNRFSQPVETWHYNCGSNRFSRVLTFVGPYLQRIETAEMGVGASGCKQTHSDRNNHSADESAGPLDRPAEKMRSSTPRRALDAAIEFRAIHERNLTAGEANSTPSDSVYQWQDELGQWHYSATPPPGKIPQN